ncbi:MAG: hypothetical protein GF401_06605 [Chitinivibrionales bacterium]|nr:hypothetical protein [Chitinivibrionales bacterium]
MEEREQKNSLSGDVSRVLETIMELSPAIEAVAQVSKDGLPTAWQVRGAASVEEIVSLAAGLFAAGCNLDVLPDTGEKKLSVTTDHGTMYIRELNESRFIMVLFARGADIGTWENAIIDLITKI